VRSTVSVEDDGQVAIDVAASRTRVFYGWIMLPIAMLGLIATSPGQTFGVSIFNEPMRQGLGLSHGQLALAYMLGTLLASLPIAYIGALMDRYGLRWTMTAAVCLFGLACLVTSQAIGWMTLLFAFFLLRLLGPGALAFLSSNTLAFWFHRRLGFVEGIRHVGMAAAMTVIPTLNLWLLGSFGWRGAYVVLGVGVWILMLPLMLLFFRNRPEDVGQSIDGLMPTTQNRDDVFAAPPLETNFTLGEALRTRSFWIVCGGTGMFGLIHTAVFFSLVPIFLDRGLSEANAAAMLTVFAVTLAVAQFVGGALADRVPAYLLLPPSLAGLAVCTLMLNGASDAWTAYASGIVMGVSQGVYFATANPLWARYFGRLHIGKIRGTLVTINVGTSSVGPLLFGQARDLFGSYDLILYTFAALPLPLVLLSFLATPPVKKTTADIET
jgi:MFS transporter, OFA family, oxalate/formate antiporter